jgi:polysaccharide pyruvyl transferase CsaB
MVRARVVLKIGIAGSYGGLNLGDEAILEGILDQLRATVAAEVTVFSVDPADTRSRHRVERVVAVRALSREEVRPEVERLDLLIFGGGGLLYDGGAMTYLREVVLAHELGVPVFVYAVSAGPLEHSRSRDAVRSALLGVTAVTVRDRRSQRLLEEIGVAPPIRLTADPALLVQVDPPSDELLTREAIRPGSRLIGMSVREPGDAAPDLDERHYHQLLSNAADFMIDRYDAAVVFVPMEARVLDLQHSHAVLSGMTHARQAVVLKREYTARQLLSLVGHFEFALGMRLHFLIFAALQRVPFVPLPYGAKVSGFIDEFGLELPGVGKINCGQLLSYVDRAWDRRADLRDRIDRTLPGLQARARETNALLLEVIAGLERGAVRGR